ncbi:ABC transporter permease [Rhodohalobacter sp. 614A]|uniref:ABC transporter permease n=1 Tax=Rhodohalobacter sp. 614A TaxID=2908649 RepID=UPI001F411242|nr:ABC transporter permease [Rhodohalobacter sp. 614A]
MLKNYIKIAVRNLWKKKFYSLINVLGLAVGIFCCIFIFLYVQDELSYDKFNTHSDRIYRVASDITFGGNHFELATAPAPMAYTLKDDFPEVREVTRFNNQGDYLVRYKEQVFKEDNVVFADSTIFKVLTFQFIEGDPNTALTAPHSVVITQTAAEKYFGSEDPIGKTLRFDNSSDMTVTGVVKDLPQNSHFHFPIYVSMSTFADSKNTWWLSNNYNTYLLLAEGTDAAEFEQKLNNHVLKNYVLPQALQLLNVTEEDIASSGTDIHYYLQSLTDIHLHSNLTVELGVNGSIQYVYIFSAIAIFVLLIACINFMNLSTARSAGRAREVGVRKVLGSGKSSLIGQFLFESVLLSMIAFLIAMAGVQIAMPYFNELSGKSFDPALFTNPELMIFLIASSLMIGLLAGIYPAFFLSSFQPVKVLKGSVSQGAKSKKLRSGLVVTQFAISIILIIGTVVIYQQLQFVQQKNPGYEKSQVLIVENAYGLEQNLPVFKENMKRLPQVENVTISSFLPVPSSRTDTPFYTGSQMTNENSVSMQIWNVDYDYIPTLKMEMADGRNFSRDMGTDSSAIVINQKAADLFGFENPIGEEIRTLNEFGEDEGYTAYHVIGVVEDFHFESMHQNIGALGLRLGRSSGLAAIRFDAAGASEIIQTARREWDKLAPDQPFSYTFMNSSFESMYRAEQRMGTIMTIFSALAIFVACLGLFAMAAFSAEQRTKEIGVRKVLGATVTDIVSLLSKDYILLVLIGFAIAVPIAWYTMSGWLKDFAYRIDINIWMFIGAGAVTLVIALLTVSWQSIKAALMNPVKSLRNE